MRLNTQIWVVVYRRAADDQFLINMPYDGPRHAALGVAKFLEDGAKFAIPVLATMTAEFVEPQKPETEPQPSGAKTDA